MEDLAGLATRRSHPDSPGSGAAPTLCPVAAQMTATKRISDALFPRGFEVASPRRSLESSRKPSSCIRRSMYPRRKKFLFPLKRFFFQPQRNNSRRQQPQRGRWRRGGSTGYVFKAERQQQHSTDTAQWEAATAGGDGVTRAVYSSSSPKAGKMRAADGSAPDVLFFGTAAAAQKRENCARS